MNRCKLPRELISNRSEILVNNVRKLEIISPISAYLDAVHSLSYITLASSDICVTSDMFIMAKVNYS